MLEYTGLLIFKYTRDNNYYSCILVLNITKAGFQHKPRIFFLFCDLDFMIFFEIVGVIHGYFGHKTWKPFVVFMKLGKKSLNLVGFGVGIHETREKKIETWRVLVVFMKRWRPVDRRFAPIDRGRHRFMKPPKPSRFQVIFYRVSWNHHQNPPGFNLFFYRVSWNHKWFQLLWPKISVKPSKISKKIMKPGHKKKMRGFSLKPHFSHFSAKFWPWIARTYS